MIDVIVAVSLCLWMIPVCEGQARALLRKNSGLARVAVCRARLAEDGGRPVAERPLPHEDEGHLATASYRNRRAGPRSAHGGGGSGSCSESGFPLCCFAAVRPYFSDSASDSSDDRGGVGNSSCGNGAGLVHLRQTGAGPDRDTHFAQTLQMSLCFAHL